MQEKIDDVVPVRCLQKNNDKIKQMKIKLNITGKSN